MLHPPAQVSTGSLCRTALTSTPRPINFARSASRSLVTRHKLRTRLCESAATRCTEHADPGRGELHNPEIGGGTVVDI